VAGPLVPGVMKALGLSPQNVATMAPSGQVCALAPDGSALLVEADRTVRPIGRQLPPGDAARFTEFTDTVRRLAAVLAPLLTSPPPSVGAPTIGDLIGLAARGRRFRGLGQRDASRLLQWVPMPIADLASDWFEDPLLQALVGARGIHGRFAGPRSAWTTLELLLQAALSGYAVADSRQVAGGPGALAAALERAARDAGVTIRTNAAVREIVVDGGRVRGLRLGDGGTIEAAVVVWSAVARSTLLDLVDAGHLGPELVHHMRHYRGSGVVAKVNLALSALPRVRALESLPRAEFGRALAGRFHIGPTLDDLERAFDRAKYGEWSPRPYLDVVIPTVADPSLAPTGQHVLSAVVQFAPRHLRTGTWAEAGPRLLEAVLETLDLYVPGIRSIVLASHVLTPEDLERTYGLTGGHIFHGEHAPDQLFVMRPMYGWANYRTPVAGLYLGGAGTHPGGGVHGACGSLAARAVLADLRRGRT
jgi:phytoene dehydrogenase-like protein